MGERDPNVATDVGGVVLIWPGVTAEAPGMVPAPGMPSR